MTPFYSSAETNPTKCKYQSAELAEHTPLTIHIIETILSKIPEDFQKRDELLKTLFEIEGHPQKLFISCLEKEMKETSDLAVVMRQISPAVCVLKYFSEPFIPSLSAAFAPIFRFSRRLRVDEISLLGTEVKSSKSTQRLKAKLHQVVDCLFRTNRLPPFLCKLCYQCAEQVEQNYSSAQTEILSPASFAVSSMIYLRILVPMMTSCPVPPEKQKGCVLTGRFLMKLCCMSEFQQAPNCLLNQVLRERLSEFGKYCDEVIKVGRRTTVSHIPFGESELDIENLKNLFSFFTEHEKSMEQTMMAAGLPVSEIQALFAFRKEISDQIDSVAPGVFSADGAFLRYIVSPVEEVASPPRKETTERPLRLKDLRIVGEYICGLGKYSGSQSDFGFRVFSAEAGEMIREIHYAHKIETPEGPRSTPISSVVVCNSTLLTCSDDGLRVWNFGSNPVAPADPHQIAYPAGMYCVTHMVLTSGPIVWCGGFGTTLSLHSFNVVSGKWKNSICLSTLPELQDARRIELSGLDYDPHGDTLWVGVSNFLIQIPLKTLSPVVRNLNIRFDKPWNGIQKILCTDTGVAWVILNDSDVIRTIRLNDLSPKLYSLKDLQIPQDVGPVTCAFVTSRGTIHTGHWDGLIVEWVYGFQDSVKTKIYPRKHLSHSISSMAVFYNCFFWTSDVEGSICVWKGDHSTSDFVQYVVPPSEPLPEHRFSVTAVSNPVALRLKDMVGIDNYMCAFGKYSGLQNDFGFRVISLETCEVLAEIHYAHCLESQDRRSSPIFAVVPYKSTIWTSSANGLCCWDTSTLKSNGSIAMRKTLSAPMNCVTHMTLTSNSIVWCGGCDSLKLSAFNAKTMKWCDSISLESHPVFKETMKPSVGGMAFDSERNILWVAIRFHLVCIKLDTQEILVRAMSEGFGDDWNDVLQLVCWPQTGTLLIFPNDSLVVRMISLEDESLNFESMIDFSLPFGIGSVTYGVITPHATLHTGHWDGQILEWEWREGSSPLPRILPRAHLKFSITSMVFLSSQGLLWSADAEGAISMWR